MSLELATILKLAPLAIRQLQRYRSSNAPKSLDRRVQAEFENDSDLTPAVVEALVNERLYVHNDPRGAVVVAGLLRYGDVVYLEALKIRAGELLSGLETLPIRSP